MRTAGPIAPSLYGVFTDRRNTLQGADHRCPRAGGLDQSIYGDSTP